MNISIVSESLSKDCEIKVIASNNFSIIDSPMQTYYLHIIDTANIQIIFYICNYPKLFISFTIS